MATTFPLQIVSPAKIVFADAATMVEVPGVEGDFGVLPGHSPLFSMIRAGVITVHLADGSKKLFWVEAGYADVTPQGTTLLAEHIRDLAPDEVAAAHAELAARSSMAVQAAA